MTGTAVDDVGLRVPTRAPDLELLGELRDSGYTESRCIVRRADGQIVQLTSLLYCLLEAVDGERDVTQLAQELSDRCGKIVSPANVEFLLDKKLGPLGLVCDADGTPPPVQKPVPLLALRCKIVVTDPAVTRKITAPFARLFRSWIVVPVLLAFVATTWWVLFRHGLASGTRQAFDSPELLLGAFALILVSAGWHEFGHAAACRAAGATPGAMGAGLYMVWPAFYTDVDDCRRLGRWGRLKVDLGGLYFNAVAAVVFMGIWLATAAKVDALLLVVAAQLLLMVRQLAPVIRADGYHILSDLVGVPDLFQHIKPTVAGMLPWNWGKPQPLRPWARWTVRAWVVIVIPILLLLFLTGVLLLPRLVATAWMGVTQQARAMTSSGANVMGLLAALLKMASLVVPVAATVYMLVRVFRRTARKAWVRTEGRPVARALTAVGAALLVLFLAFAWWPAGQYKPVSADEGGTVGNLWRMRSASAAGASSGEFWGKPIAGVKPVSGWALVPRDSDAPALVVVRGDDGALQGIVTEGDQAGLAFPFVLPDAPGEGDNQALAVNTDDGKVVYDVAVSLVWVTDGEAADSRNEAYALASCTACTTVAVSFQVVLIVGQTDVVTPVNLAVAINNGCVACQTEALAVQLVLTLQELPSEELQAQIDAAMARIEGIDLLEVGLTGLYTEIKAVQAEITTLLTEAGLVAEGTTPASSTASTAVTTSTTVAGEDGSGDGGGSTSATSTTSTTESGDSTTTTTEAAESTTTTSTTANDSTTTTTSP